MHSVIIRKAKESNLPNINQLTLQLVDTINKKAGIDLRVVSRNSRSLFHSPNSYFLVAEIDGSKVGFVHFTTRKTMIHHGRSGLIDELVVAKNCRRAGISRRLLSAQRNRTRKQESSMRAVDLKNVESFSRRI